MRRKIQWAIVLLMAGTASQAQTAWTVRSSEDSLASVEAVGSTMAAQASLARLADLGLLLARVDSVAEATVWVTPGPEVRVGRVDVVGTSRLDPAAVRTGWATRTGAVFRPSVLTEDLRRSAERYTTVGHADVRLTPRLHLDAGAVDVMVEVSEGTPARIGRVELVGARRASAGLAARLAGVGRGDPLDGFDGDAVRRGIEASGLYLRVGTPTLAREADGSVTVQVPVEEGAPGAFDLVLGYLPPATGTPGQVVGSGRLDLRNPLGGGRSVAVALVRNPGLVSSAHVAVLDPFVLGLPVQAGLAFDGTGRDSTFSRVSGRAEAGYRLGPGLLVSFSASRESVSPGTFGAGLVDGVPRIRASAATFYGAGITFRRLDSVLNPRRGVSLAALVESGRRQREAASDSLVGGSVRQQRLTAEVRAVVPATRRQVVVLGIDAFVLAATPGSEATTRAYDEGELFRYGGASSLRGYDEDTFVGNAVGRLVGEVRHLIDAESHVFVFTDLGFVRRPVLPGRPSADAVRPGYGAGLQVQTGLGLVRLTYALNPDLPLGRGKLHVGLRLGL